MKSAAVQIEGLPDRVIDLVRRGLADHAFGKDPPARTAERMIREAVGVQPIDQEHLIGWACGVLAAMREEHLPYPSDISRASRPLDTLWAAISGEVRSAAAQSRAARCGQAWRLGIRVASIESGTKVMRAIEQQAQQTGESQRDIAERVVRAQAEVDARLPDRSLVPILLDAVSPGAGGSESRRMSRVATVARVQRQDETVDLDVAALTIADIDQLPALASRIAAIVDRKDFESFVEFVRARYEAVGDT